MMKYPEEFKRQALTPVEQVGLNKVAETMKISKATVDDLNIFSRMSKSSSYLSLAIRAVHGISSIVRLYVRCRQEFRSTLGSELGKMFILYSLQLQLQFIGNGYYTGVVKE